MLFVCWLVGCLLVFVSLVLVDEWIVVVICYWCGFFYYIIVDFIDVIEMLLDIEMVLYRFIIGV